MYFYLFFPFITTDSCQIWQKYSKMQIVNNKFILHPKGITVKFLWLKDVFL